MSTVRTCTTPEEGWSLYSHFLGNNLLTIRLRREEMDEEKDEALREKHERVISDTWSHLVGVLYIIMRRMVANGYQGDAVKMQQIIDMVIELDLSDPATHEAIHSKHRELDIKRRDFEAQLKKFQALNSK